MASTQLSGSCLCGKVSYAVAGPIKVFQYCHCSRCRKTTGSAHAANIFVAPEYFKWLSGEELVNRFELPEAKNYASSFCSSCGSTLPWLNKTGTTYIIPAGTLDDGPAGTPTQHIHWDSKAPWYEVDADLPKHATLPGR